MAPVIRAAALVLNHASSSDDWAEWSRASLSLPHPRGCPLRRRTPSPAAPTAADLEAQQRWQSQAQQELFAALRAHGRRATRRSRAGAAEAQAVSREASSAGRPDRGGGPLVHRPGLGSGRHGGQHCVRGTREAAGRGAGDAGGRAGHGLARLAASQGPREADRAPVAGRLRLLLQHRPDTGAVQSGIELVPDERVALGGCLVETGAAASTGAWKPSSTLRRVLLQARGEGRRASGGRPMNRYAAPSVRAGSCSAPAGSSAFGAADRVRRPRLRGGRCLRTVTRGATPPSQGRGGGAAAREGDADALRRPGRHRPGRRRRRHRRPSTLRIGEACSAGSLTPSARPLDGRPPHDAGEPRVLEAPSRIIL